MTHGLTSTMSHMTSKWKDLADGVFDMGEWLNFGSLSDKLLGSIGWQTMKLLLTLLSYVCSVHWLCLQLQKECEKRSVHINFGRLRFSRRYARRMNHHHGMTSESSSQTETETEQSSDETEEHIPMRLRNRGQYVGIATTDNKLELDQGVAPPPYQLGFD